MQGSGRKNRGVSYWHNKRAGTRSPAPAAQHGLDKYELSRILRRLLFAFLPPTQLSLPFFSFPEDGHHGIPVRHSQEPHSFVPRGHELADDHAGQVSQVRIRLSQFGDLICDRSEHKPVPPRLVIQRRKVAVLRTRPDEVESELHLVRSDVKKLMFFRHYATSFLFLRHIRCSRFFNRRMRSRK